MNNLELLQKVFEILCKLASATDSTNFNGSIKATFNNYKFAFGVNFWKSAPYSICFSGNGSLISCGEEIINTRITNFFDAIDHLVLFNLYNDGEYKVTRSNL